MAELVCHNIGCGKSPFSVSHPGRSLVEKPKQEVGKSNSHIRLSKKMVMRPARTVVTRLEKKTTQEVKSSALAAQWREVDSDMTISIALDSGDPFLHKIQ